MKAMDVLGQEVVKFMATSASMKAEDLNRLEDQIRFKLAGVGAGPPLSLSPYPSLAYSGLSLHSPPIPYFSSNAMAYAGSSGLTLTAEQIAAARKEAYRAKKMQDPWVAMAEFEIEQSVKEAFMRKEMEATEKLHVKHTLDIQLQEKDALKHRAKLRDMEYAAEEQRVRRHRERGRGERQRQSEAARHGVRCGGAAGASALIETRERQRERERHGVRCGGAVGASAQGETMERGEGERETERERATWGTLRGSSGCVGTGRDEREEEGGGWRPLHYRAHTSMDLVGSHGRWRRPCLQTAHAPNKHRPCEVAYRPPSL